MGSTDTGLGGGDTDQGEARRIAARKIVAEREARDIRDRRLADMEQARAEARYLRDQSESAAHGPVGDAAEEIAALVTAVMWMAAETRCQRVEVADRGALNQELGRPFRLKGEQEEAEKRLAEAEADR